ncbi:hypothetical protein D0T85_21960 [Bacteroides sp. 519]|nr:hypothetical protein [Bacteroides sp. 519]
MNEMQHFINAKCSILKIGNKIGHTTRITVVRKAIFHFLLLLGGVKQVNKAIGFGKIFHY